MNDLTDLSLRDLSAGITARHFSPVDVVEAHLSRIAALEPRLHAFVNVHAAEAKLAAEAADKAIRSGHGLGPLHGIPIALKDLVEFKDQVTTRGCAVNRDRVSTYTATLAQKLLGAGMIVLGKTHTVEFAYGAWGTNQHMGTPWNPWDMKTQRTPGGSSSGSAVAVAARMAPCAIGTDTGGSVRVPASWCGITGLKTSVGRISTYGVLPLLGHAMPPQPRIGLQLRLYGYGILMMMSGLAGAGLMGAPRKMAGNVGVEFSVETISRVFLGIGGSLATAGILMFLYLVLRQMWPGLALRVARHG